MTPPGPPPRLLARRYVLGPAVGRGRSTVFRARDQRLQREVAVKQVDVAACEPFGSGRNESLRARALREARALARVSSPQAVSVFDVVEEHGSLWLVMELVDAPSLRALVERYGPLDDRRAALIGLDVLAALAAAHATGVVHRDVKPSNVLVPRSGPAKLTDFGVASVRDDEQLTAPGMVIGSPSYMAPEQACGRPVGPEADLWALGAMLYFAVEGRAPFPGGSPVAAATAVVHQSPRPQERPGPLTAVITRLLAKNPHHRPSASTVRRELAAIAYRPGISDRRPGARRAGTGAGIAGDRASEGTQALDMRTVMASGEHPPGAGQPPADPARHPDAMPAAPRRRGRRNLHPAATARRRSRELVAAAAAVAAVALGAGAFAASSMDGPRTVSPATAGSPPTEAPPASEGRPTSEQAPTTEAAPTTAAPGTGADVVTVTAAATDAPTSTTAPQPPTTPPETTTTAPETTTTSVPETTTTTVPDTTTTTAPETTTTSVPDTTTTTAPADDGGQAEGQESIGSPDDGEAGGFSVEDDDSAGSEWERQVEDGAGERDGGDDGEDGVPDTGSQV
ncbi:MAG TPA: protein kinase [Acidimicrobiales bacterium]